jgi:hypothetical protein
MFCKSRFATEASFACWLLTNIWTLSRVNPPMASQTGGIRESLLTAFVITDMRFFAGVSSRMYCQSTALDEALVAVLYCAVIRSLVGVNAIMATEIGLAIERLATLFPSAVEVATTPRSHNSGVLGCGGSESGSQEVKATGDQVTQSVGSGKKWTPEE